MERYKEVERAHYEAQLSRRAAVPLDVSGARAVDESLREPYLAFEAAVRTHALPGARIMDLGAGTGLHTLTAREAALRVPVDISFGPLQVAVARGARAGIAVEPVVADAERLPVADGSMDVVTSAGALYCFNFAAVCVEVRRVLRSGGAWIIVDSFDHNPIYRANRWVGMKLGRRTALAVENIPNSGTLRQLRSSFGSVTVTYHGVFAFLAPLLRRLIGGRRTAALLSRMDDMVPGMRDLSFKIVVIATAVPVEPRLATSDKPAVSLQEGV